MSFLELLLIGIGLSMDAFAVAICQGLCMPKLNLRHGTVIALFFGVFQALMPLIGYLIGAQFAGSIEAYSAYIAFALLALIGINMIREALGENDEAEASAAISVKAMLPMAVATSIDALAVGVTFAMQGAFGGIGTSVAIIGATTCLLSMIGVKVGSVFGAKYEKKAQLLGGAILILLGLKMLLSHFGVL